MKRARAVDAASSSIRPICGDSLQLPRHWSGAVFCRLLHHVDVFLWRSPNKVLLASFAWSGVFPAHPDSATRKLEDENDASCDTTDISCDFPFTVGWIQKVVRVEALRSVGDICEREI
jgi:hypothetical protein